MATASDRKSFGCEIGPTPRHPMLQSVAVSVQARSVAASMRTEPFMSFVPFMLFQSRLLEGPPTAEVRSAARDHPNNPQQAYEFIRNSRRAASGEWGPKSLRAAACAARSPVTDGL